MQTASIPAKVSYRPYWFLLRPQVRLVDEKWMGIDLSIKNNSGHLARRLDVTLVGLPALELAPIMYVAAYMNGGPSYRLAKRTGTPPRNHVTVQHLSVRNLPASSTCSFTALFKRMALPCRELRLEAVSGTLSGLGWFDAEPAQKLTPRFPEEARNTYNYYQPNASCAVFES